MDIKNDRVLITNNVPYGSVLSVAEGRKVAKGDVICSWDPFNNVIVAEIAGTIEFENVIDGVTYREEADEQTGHREKVVIESKDKTRIPSLKIKGSKESKELVACFKGTLRKGTLSEQ
jgi:DNA-directed RNA polymerase subunit beta'